MILITGGAFQGKTAYAKEAFGLTDEEIAEGSVCREEDLYKVRAVKHFHEYVRRCLEEGRETEGLAGHLAEKNPELIILTNELGCGVVPVNAFDRQWREAAGRFACDLAKQAKEVHRVVCGIGTVIKHA